MADEIRIRDFGLHIENSLDLPQLRMQALTLLKDMIRSPVPIIEVNKDVFELADHLVHYCLTGKHQSPEKNG